MKTFRMPEAKMFHVVEERLVRDEDGRLTSEPHTVSPWPLTWHDARSLIEVSLLLACRDTKIIDVNLEVAGPKRPWSEVTLQAYLDMVPEATIQAPKSARQMLVHHSITLQAMAERTEDVVGLTDLEMLTSINDAALARLSAGGGA